MPFWLDWWANSKKSSQNMMFFLVSNAVFLILLSYVPMFPALPLPDSVFSSATFLKLGFFSGRSRLAICSY